MIAPILAMAGMSAISGLSGSAKEVKQEEVSKGTESLEAINEISKMGVKTTLGVSNISFGLPNRELINHTFLTMALL